MTDQCRRLISNNIEPSVSGSIVDSIHPICMAIMMQSTAVLLLSLFLLFYYHAL